MRLWTRIRRWFRRSQFEADLAEEIRIHREMERDDRQAGGTARFFGSETLAVEQSRDVWGLTWIDSFLQDVRYAWRGCQRAPGFALTVIGTIGLGLGINTTLFTVLNTYVFRTIPVSDPNGLYEVWWQSKDRTWRATWSQYGALRRDNSVFTDVAAYSQALAPLDNLPAIGDEVSDNYFALLNPGVALGRLIAPGDRDVIVLSFDTWRRSFGANPGLLDQHVRLRGRPLEVIGVTAMGFSGTGEVGVDFWVPRTPSAVRSDPQEYRLLARFKPEISPEVARGVLLAWSQANTAGQPLERRAVSAHVISRATPAEFSPTVLASLAPLFAGFGLVLAIACVNVSNMMLARALSRHREIAIRVSLGAGRSRLIRQLMTESLLLALGAAVTGIAISTAMIRFAVWLVFRTLPAELARMVNIPSLDADWRVFAFSLIAAVGAALLFGLIPAFQTVRSRIAEATRGDFSRDQRPSRLRNALMAGQVGACALLLICSGVALRSQRLLTGQDIHIRTEGVFSVAVSKPLPTTAVERLRASAAIEGVAAVWRSPLSNELVKLEVVPSGSASAMPAGYNFVSPEYFSLLRIPLVRGRIFTSDEARAGEAVVVISAATARHFWPGDEPLGKTIVIPSKRQADRRSDRLPLYSSARVIGVAGDVVNGFAALGVDPTCLYFPTVAGTGLDSLLVATTRGNGAGSLDVQRALDDVAPDAADQINPLSEIHDTMIYPFRVAFWLTGFLSGLAALFTVSGIYGVLSHLISQRTKEIGIRMALGAGHGAIVRMVTAQSMLFVAVGSAIGALLALLVAPVFANRVEAIRPYDIGAYLGALLLVAASALAASFYPVRRAVAVDPVTALRCD
jgi:predicted permease